MTDIKNDTEYVADIFSQIEVVAQKISNTTFEQCHFSGCDFSESEFIQCRFIECEFRDCNFNVTKLTGSRFWESQFENCKLTGINWTSLNWTGITVSAPMAFESSDLSFSVFHSLSLPGLKMTNSKARNEAVNYYIDPNNNSMVGASFSFPEVISLLAAFDINVKGSF